MAARKQLMIRVPMETYYALQLAHPFVRRDSMQDLVAGIIDEFLENLRTTEPGFEKALAGFRESEARKEGVLTRRGVTKNDSVK